MIICRGFFKESIENIIALTDNTVAKETSISDVQKDNNEKNQYTFSTMDKILKKTELKDIEDAQKSIKNSEMSVANIWLYLLI